MSKKNLSKILNTYGVRALNLFQNHSAKRKPIQINATLHKKIKNYCVKNGIVMSRFVEYILTNGLREMTEQEGGTDDS
jgi:hypothetical protein